MDSYDQTAGSGGSAACMPCDVARVAGVSTAMVSRVVNGKDTVRSSAPRRVPEVIEAPGHTSDGAARSLAKHPKEVIGLVAVESCAPPPDVEPADSLFIEEVLRGVRRSLDDLGWSVLLTFLRDSDLAEAYQRMQRVSAKVDGMIIAEGIVGPEQLGLLAARIPIALIAAYPGALHADVIGADNRSGTRAAVRHMVEQHGRMRLFYIAGPPAAQDARERRSAFEEAVAEHPGATVTGYFEGRFAAISGQQAVREILAGPRRELPDAIICGNDRTAIGAMRELQAAGIRVPADVAVVGFDDTRLSAWLAPSLTTIRQPMQLLGERACSRLLERIADPTLPPQAERLPTELIIRESCGCGPARREPRPRLGATRAAPERHDLALSRHRCPCPLRTGRDHWRDKGPSRCDATCRRRHRPDVQPVDYAIDPDRRGRWRRWQELTHVHGVADMGSASRSRTERSRFLLLSVGWPGRSADLADAAVSRRAGGT
jgi:LacI family transcriptional regulator